MPPAKKPAASRSRSSATTSRSRTSAFKEPAALRRLNTSIEAAEKALADLRTHAGRDVSQTARQLYKDIGTFVKSARRDSGKFAKALKSDFDQAQIGRAHV